MRHSRSIPLFALVVLLSACTVATVGPTGAGNAPMGVVKNGVPALTSGELTGVAKAPVLAAGADNVKGGVLQGAGVSLIANDGSTLIGNDGSSLISNDGGGLVAQGAGNFHTLAVDEDLQELPLAGATVLLRDARTMALLPNVKPVRTDGLGRFTCKNVPANVMVLVDVVFVGKAGKAIRVASLGRAMRAAQARPVSVSQASTMVVARMVASAKADSNQIYVMRQDALDAAVNAVDRALTKDPEAMREAAKTLGMADAKDGKLTVERDLDADDFREARASVDRMEQADASVATELNSASKELEKTMKADEAALAEQAAAVAKQPVLDATPTPTPDAPVATPTPEAPVATPTPTPTPTPATAATSTPTPTPVPVARVESMSPLTGPLGAVVTVRGSGFGDKPGVVQTKPNLRNVTRRQMNDALGIVGNPADQDLKSDVTVVSWSDTSITLKLDSVALREFAGGKVDFVIEVGVLPAAGGGVVAGIYNVNLEAPQQMDEVTAADTSKPAVAVGGGISSSKGQQTGVIGVIRAFK